jgi:hypothetical protein
MKTRGIGMQAHTHTYINLRIFCIFREVNSAHIALFYAPGCNKVEREDGSQE